MGVQSLADMLFAHTHGGLGVRPVPGSRTRRGSRPPLPPWDVVWFFIIGFHFP